MAFKKGIPFLQKHPKKEKERVRQIDSSEGALFAGLNRLSQAATTALATLLVSRGHARFVVDNISLFRGCKLRDLTKAMLDAGDTHLVLKHISDLRSGFRDGADMLETFISRDRVETPIVNLLEKIPGLTPSVALDVFIEHDRSDLVLKNLYLFSEIKHMDIAERFLGHKDVDAFFLFMRKFPDHGHERGEMRERFIEDFRGLEGTPFAEIDRLPQDERERAILDLLRSDQDAVTKNFSLLFLYFEGADLATLLASHGHARLLVDNISLFQGHDLPALVEAMLDAGDSDLVFEHVSDLGSVSFDGFSVALESLISRGHADTAIANLVEKILEENPRLYPGIVLNPFFELGRSDLVLEHLDSFSGIERMDIATRFLRAGDVNASLAFMREFPEGGAEREEMLSLFIKERHGRFVVERLDDQFSDFDRSYIATLLFRSRQGNLALENSDSFPDLKPADMIELFLKNGDGATLAKRLDYFSDIDPETIARRFFARRRGDIVAEHLHRFGKNMSHSFASDLADPKNFPDSARTGLRAVFLNRSSFDPPLTKEDLVAFTDQRGTKDKEQWLFGDPNRDHPDRLNPEKRKEARKILRLLEGEPVSGYSARDAEKFSAFREKIDSAVDDFFDSISSEGATSDDAAPANTIPDGEVSALRRLVPRWVLESTALYLSNSPEAREYDNFTFFLFRILTPALRRMQELYTIDIPLYDIVYEAFDDLRADKDSLLEVYLGRDGVYAFLGRRAEDVARRRAMGPTARKRIKEDAARRQDLDPAAKKRIKIDGEVLGIHPRYVVYPRTFIENLTLDEKQEYLRPLDIPSNNTIFFDTGFEGSVPSDIMRCLGFSESEIDEHIHLLSATTDARRIRNVRADRQTRENVLKIEESAKPEESATGLYLDQHAGLLRHTAEPTSPSEQFTFSLIRKTLISYYYRKSR